MSRSFYSSLLDVIGPLKGNTCLSIYNKIDKLALDIEL